MTKQKHAFLQELSEFLDSNLRRMRENENWFSFYKGQKHCLKKQQSITNNSVGGCPIPKKRNSIILTNRFVSSQSQRNVVSRGKGNINILGKRNVDP